MDIINLIKKFFINYLEETLENIEIISLLNNKNSLENILIIIEKEINFVLNSSVSKIKSHYKSIGKTLYENKISFIILINIFEKFKNEFLYAVNNKKIKYNENEILLKIDAIIQSIAQEYFLLTIQDIEKNIKKENISFEIDINTYKNWYIEFLNAINNEKNLENFLILEKTECFKWINSLDFKLLTKAGDINTTNEIIILTEKIFELAREIVFYKDKNNFKNAYSFLIMLDQKINFLNNILEKISISFLNNKIDYFFELFSEIILFKKEFAYFLVFTLKTSPKIIYKKSLYNTFFNIFHYTKEKIKELDFDVTGIISDTDSIHFLVSYKDKKQLKTIFKYMVNLIENYKNNELILNIPDFYLTAANTEVFSGLDSKYLKKIAHLMTKKIENHPYYHFRKKEIKNLTKEAKKEIEIEKKIENAIKNKEINLGFQPIIHFENNKKTIEYCEILSRINFKNKQIDMQTFIDHVVEKNLTAQFDSVVYEKLLEKIGEIKKYLKGISLNIFPSSFVNQNIITQLKNIIKKCQENNLFLILEITEYHLFEYYSIIKQLKNEFPETLKIALDDFGSGYSSFSILIKLSKNNLLDIIKIDGSITKDILNNEINLDILKMSIEIAKKLNKKVVIEYIENRQIEEKIKTITQDFYAQGFLYAKALPLEKIKNLKF